MATIANELEKARQSLLDLTMRNRLLNYRPTAVRSIRVTGEVPSEIYDALVLREKTLEFRGTGRRKRRDAELALDAAHLDEARRVSRDAEVWTARAEGELEAQHTDRFLQTPYDDEALEKKLFRVYHEGRIAVEEQGYTVVHLAIGFLEWFESEDSDQPRRAPLILVPVELERVRAGDFSRVRWTGEDVFANISLIARLVDQGVALPPFDAPEEKSGIDVWLQQVVDAVARKQRWRVLSEMTLDFFSFTKFVMFKDLDPATWPEGTRAEDHPLLQSLFHPELAPKDAAGFDETEIDRRLTARDLWHVRDADPSQIAVIEDVKAGRNLVVQGPPGTGKSQTITNIISETLAAGRTVLFVSEKMAALQVVKSRLDEAGLSPFCLELHSRKANKKAVLSELQRSLRAQPLPPLNDDVFDEHERFKRELNIYAAELGMPVGQLQKTPFALFEMRLGAMTQLTNASAVRPRLTDAAQLTAADVAVAEQALRMLADLAPLVQPIALHPWRASTRAAMLAHEEDEVASLLQRTSTALQEMHAAAAAMASAAGVRVPLRLTEVERSLRAARVMARAEAPTEAALLLGSEWNAPNADAETLVARLETFQCERAELAHLFHAIALDGDHARALNEFAKLSTGLLRIFNGHYRALRAQLAALFLAAVPKTPRMVAELSRLVEHQGVRDALRGDVRGRALFGVRWQADRSDCLALREFAEWLVAFRRELLADALTQKAIDVASGRTNVSAVLAAIARLESAAASFRTIAAELLTELQIDAVSAFGGNVEDAALSTIESTLEAWQQQLPSLFRWSQFNAARNAALATAAAPLEPLLVADHLDADAVLPFFRAAVAESLLRVAFAERAALGHFVGELHEKKIDRFRTLDHDLVRLNRARLSRRLHERRPQISGGASPRSEMGILIGEFNRVRSHLPIRRLLAKAGGLIQRIKPCFLMSPLSVAQFLDPRSARFDLIVFDEASQVRREDAIGALLRGTQLVVMGDKQQLPPTSFFDRLGTDDESSDDDADEAAGAPQAASMVDVESILHQCERSFPTRVLNWHYRSRHESLIAISNNHFYDNRLRVYPSATAWSEHSGVHFVHLPSSRYDRGKSSTNRIEAQAVAAAAIEHFRTQPHRSLGIGTFNMKQQQAILEEVELLLKLNPEMEPYFSGDRPEHFFVKNLETIQGDERDVILISVCFGRDMAGRLSTNFGPINREGGERRLNVLMSRAREKCVVFSNFTASDLAVDGASPKGLVTLKAFLSFAETRRSDFESSSTNDVISPFIDAVAAVLREHGHDVRQQVGCGESRVDFAVIDPEERGRYLLGIECDGAKYHAAPVARDRDRLRQHVLENLGWTIHRVWSTDWYRNPAEATERLLQAVETARRAPKRVDLHESPPAATSKSSYATASSDDAANATYLAGETAADLPPDHGTLTQVTLTAAIFGGAREAIGGFSFSTAAFHDIPDYEVCRSLRISTRGELHQESPHALASAVQDIVIVEGPVHADEVVRRIRTIWGLQRAGNRIREAIDRGVTYALMQKIIERDGEFFFVPGAAIRLRRRNGDPPPKIDLICDAEIAEAIRHVLRVQFATSGDDLVGTAARRLGIQATSGAIADRIDSVVQRELRSGRLLKRPSGDICIPD